MKFLEPIEPIMAIKPEIWQIISKNIVQSYHSEAYILKYYNKLS